MQMKNEVSRRGFLSAALVAALGLAGSAVAADCPATENNPEGPFYIPDAPYRNQLAPATLPGERLRMSGRILAAPGCQPLAGAVLDLWHANAAGFYYGLEASRPLSPEEYLLRGRLRTDEDGRYEFDTILPGNYRVSETWMRPRHIHFIAGHPSRRSLTSQIYFEGDPQNRTDRLVKSSLIIPLGKEGGGYVGTFDIALSGS